jgi:DNA-binding CsgD family transcriptional regulator
MNELVGRSLECARIDRMISGARAHRGSALVLRGAPGAGKSALIDWTIAQAPDHTVLRTSGTRHDASAPFSSLESLLRHDGHGAGSAGEHLATLATHLAEGTPSIDRFIIALVLFRILSALAEHGPVLVAIDDAQWADSFSVEALLFALPRLEGDAVAMLFAVRDGEPNALDGAGLPTLELGGLGADDASALLEGVVAAAVAEELARHTAGNPRALLELAAALDDDQRRGTAPISPELLRVVDKEPERPKMSSPREQITELLTERELQIARLVATGMTSSEAASELFLSRRTVEHHLASVYRKLSIRNRTELSALFNAP